MTNLDNCSQTDLRLPLSSLRHQYSSKFYSVKMDSNSSRSIYKKYHLEFSSLNTSKVRELKPSTWTNSSFPFSLPVSFPFFGLSVKQILIWRSGLVTLPEINSKDKVLIIPLRNQTIYSISLSVRRHFQFNVVFTELRTHGTSIHCSNNRSSQLY